MGSQFPHDTRSDEALIAALNRGDASAFDAIYYRYRDWAVRLAHRFTQNEADALDVLQETFAYLFRKFPGFILTARMTTFLYPVVKNLSIAARRKRERQISDETAPDPVAPTVASDPAQIRSELALVMAALPEAQREVLLMRFVDEMSLAEIGEALGIPEGTVKSRMHNALATLKADARARRYFEK
ncbi:MAG TPA: sigma-70 family RNA polymerase sigma factor [Tepidisphaeraceae bacterium]|nr:sigma-70 family RNA polymerase sigma factor [Tepidisphaeraceae bacterium]